MVPNQSFGCKGRESYNIMDVQREIFEFAASAGALEGYVFEKAHMPPGILDDWVHNLVRQYEGFPDEIKAHFQGSLDRTVGRAVQSLIPVLGPEHPHVKSLKTLIAGEMPASSRDFNREKEEKSKKYGS